MIASPAIEALRLIVEIVMILTMAQQIAGAGLITRIHKLQQQIGIWRHYLCVKIDQVRIVRQVALRTSDAVRIVANIARRILATNMFIVFRKTLVIQDAVTAVAAITQRIVRRALRRVVDRLVIAYKDRLEGRTVRTFRTRPAGAPCLARIVAVRTGHH